jgi:hypothetical protein
MLRSFTSADAAMGGPVPGYIGPRRAKSPNRRCPNPDQNLAIAPADQILFAVTVKLLAGFCLPAARTAWTVSQPYIYTFAALEINVLKPHVARLGSFTRSEVCLGQGDRSSMRNW